MKAIKRFERFAKRNVRLLLGKILKQTSLEQHEINRNDISKILLVRQDSRLGNLILMTPMLSGLREDFPMAQIDVLISEGFQEVLEINPNVDNVLVFRKSNFRMMPWKYPGFLAAIRSEKYDLAIDVSDGRHFSLNNILLTSLSGARYRMGYDREDARSFLNCVMPLPPENTHMSDALAGLVTFISCDEHQFPLQYYMTEEDISFAEKWCCEHDIKDFDSYFIVHPGGKGKKRWGADNFSYLIDRLQSEIGVRVVVIGSAADHDEISRIKEIAPHPFDVLDNVTIGEMAAVIDRCDVFISGDTGPMHVSSALGRPTIGIFTSSNFRVFGPRGINARIVLGDSHGSVDDVLLAVRDILGGATENT